MVQQTPKVKQNCDDELIARWQGGDKSAFEELVRAWQQPIARFLTHYAGDAAIIEDLCQEIFLRVYLAREKYQSTGAFSTWIYHIALNVARDQFRRNSRDRKNQKTLTGKPESDDETADRNFERDELQELVSEALAELTEPLRLTVVLRHFEEMSYADMARLLKTPESTLKSRFAAALTRLHARLQLKGWNIEDLTQ